MKIQTQHQLPDYLKNKKKKLKYQIHFSMIQHITYLSFNVKKSRIYYISETPFIFLSSKIWKKRKTKSEQIWKILFSKNLITYRSIDHKYRERISETIGNTNVPTPRFPIKVVDEEKWRTRLRIGNAFRGLFSRPLSLSLVDIIQRYTIVNYVLSLQWSVVLSSTCLAPLNNALTRKRDTGEPNFRSNRLRVREIPR